MSQALPEQRRTTETPFLKGDRIKLLNGKKGTVVEFSDPIDRWWVNLALDDGREIHVSWRYDVSLLSAVELLADLADPQ